MLIGIQQDGGVFQCSVTLVAVFACTKKPQLREFCKTFITAVCVCIVVYSFTGCFGYLSFGSCVKADILSSYHPTADVVVGVSLVAVNLITSYPIFLYVGRYRQTFLISLLCSLYCIHCIAFICSRDDKYYIE